MPLTLLMDPQLLGDPSFLGDGEATDVGYAKFRDCCSDSKSTRKSPHICLSMPVIAYERATP